MFLKEKINEIIKAWGCTNGGAIHDQGIYQLTHCVNGSHDDNMHNWCQGGYM